MDVYSMLFILNMENRMKGITAVLNEPAAAEVRNAACMAGGDRIVITPLPYWMCGVDMVDICCETKATQAAKYVRLEVAADNNRFYGIASAIRNIVRAGQIILASRLDRQSGRAA